MEIYVIRHGETDFNVRKLMLSRQDVSLNKTGEEQVKEAATKLKDIHFDMIISSPLKRTLQTSMGINKVREEELELVLDARLMERDAGALSGKSLDLKLFSDYWSIKKNKKIENGERIGDFLFRVYSFLEEIKIKYKDKKILIVTHNGVCRAINACVKGIEKIEDIKDLGQKNCEIKVFNI